MHEFTCSLAPFAPPPPEMVTLFGSLAASQEQKERFFGMLSGATSVAEFFGPQPSR